MFAHLATGWARSLRPKSFSDDADASGRIDVGRAADGSPLAAACPSARPETRDQPPAAPLPEGMPSMRRRVVVTGIGWVTPLGTDIESVWQRLLHGESGVGYTTLFDASNFPTKISAEVRNWDLSDVGENPTDWKYQGRHTHFAVGAAKKAVADSGSWTPALDPTRFGVYTGSGEGQQDFDRFTQMMVAGLDGGDRSTWPASPEGPGNPPPVAELEQEPNMPAGHLASLFNAQGPNVNCLTACAASSQAVGEAAEIIRRGEADVMLAGGTHSMIHPFGVTGFNLLTALSTHNDEPTRASRPFDRDRDGFVLGEGAGMVVLEDLDTRQGPRRADLRRDRRLRLDGRRLPHHRHPPRGPRRHQLHEDGPGRRRPRARTTSTTSTPTAPAPRSTTRSRRWPSSRSSATQAYKVPVSSTKSMMGHLIAAAGATELIICLLAIRDNVLPPTINYETPTPIATWTTSPTRPREARCDVALSQQFRFRRPEHRVDRKRFAG